MEIHFILIYFYEKYTEVYSGSSQSSKMERFAKIVNYIKTMYCMSEWVLITPLKCMTLCMHELHTLSPQCFKQNG